MRRGYIQHPKARPKGPGFLLPAAAVTAIPDETKWCVSAEAVGRVRRTHQRETKVFPNDEEARLYAKEMVLADRKKNIIAGTFLSPNNATRCLFSGRELLGWIWGTDD